MAVQHRATIVPTKLELLQAWVPRQPWLGGADASTLTQLGAYRFDDPAGEVGIETHLLGTADGQVLQVPLTYRGAPVPDLEPSLITTMTHTALGDRWVYDACSDPVHAAALTRAIFTGGRQADLFVSTDDGLVPLDVTAQVRGSGSPSDEVPDVRVTVAHDGTVTRIGGSLELLRVPGAVSGSRTLIGTWSGQATPLLLARWVP